jgi:hypothetical protein
MVDLHLLRAATWRHVYIVGPEYLTVYPQKISAVTGKPKYKLLYADPVVRLLRLSELWLPNNETIRTLTQTLLTPPAVRHVPMQIELDLPPPPRVPAPMETRVRRTALSSPMLGAVAPRQRRAEVVLQHPVSPSPRDVGVLLISLRGPTGPAVAVFNHKVDPQGVAFLSVQLLVKLTPTATAHHFLDLSRAYLFEGLAALTQPSLMEPKYQQYGLQFQLLRLFTTRTDTMREPRDAFDGTPLYPALIEHLSRLGARP